MGGYAGDLWPKRKQIRTDRRSATIAGNHDLMRVADWVYCVEEIDGEQAICIINYLGEGTDPKVPHVIDGKLVRAIHNKAFYGNKRIKTLNMANTVTHIGTRVFAGCGNLEQAYLSNSITQLDGSIFHGCTRLREVHLPAALAVLPGKLLESCPVEVLRLPRGLAEVQERSYNAAVLKRIEVEEGSTTFSSDGTCLFSADGRHLLHAAVKVGEYAVPEGCVSVGPSAFKGMRGLGRVSFPAGLEHIAPYAFFGTGLTRVELPESLLSIGDHAFYLCEGLREVAFGRALERVEDGAFGNTALARVELPRNLAYLSCTAFEGSQVDYCDPASFGIDETNPHLVTRDAGLYLITSGGLELLGCLGHPEELRVAPATFAIGKEALAGEKSLRRVVVHAGLHVICAKAFSNCTALEEVVLPDSLESIGAQAFWETALTHLHLGPDVHYLGINALSVSGFRKDPAARTLRTVTIDPRNEHFYVENDLVCEYLPGGDRALLFLGNTDEVTIPAGVRYISDMCFHYARLRVLRVHAGLRRVNRRALSGLVGLERVELEPVAPREGQEPVEVAFPGYDYAVDKYMQILSLDVDGTFFDFALYDLWVRGVGNPVTFAHLALTRLEHPVKLAPESVERFTRGIRTSAEVLVKRYVDANDLAALSRLARHGLLEAQALDAGLAYASAQGASEAVAHLLNLKHETYGMHGEEDFSL